MTMLLVHMNCLIYFTKTLIIKLKCIFPKIYKRSNNKIDTQGFVLSNINLVSKFMIDLNPRMFATCEYSSTGCSPTQLVFQNVVCHYE